MIAEVKDIMLGLPVSSSAELHDKLLKGFYEDGYFNPTRRSLESTGLYTSEEITSLLTDPESLIFAKQFIYELEKLDTEVLNDIYADENFLVVQDGYKNRMGTFILSNPYLVEQRAIELLGGIQNREEFEDVLHLEDELQNLRSPYWDKYETKDDLFFKFKNYTRVAEIEVEDGQMSAKTTNTRAYLNQVLTEPKNDLLEKNIEYLLGLDEQIINENRKEVDKIITLIKGGMLDMGIDVTNLDDVVKEKSMDDFKSFIGALRSFILTESPQAFDNLVGEYDTFFNVDDSFKYKAVQLSKDTPSKNSFFYKTNANGVTLFRDLGLLPVGENTYRRFSKDMSLDDIYEKVYEQTISNGYTNILSEEAFRPTGYDADGTINLSKITDPENKEAILRGMRTFIQSQIAEVYTGKDNVTQEDIEKYVLMFNYINKSNNLNKFNEAPAIDTEYSIFAQDISNQDYLQTDFIADFNVKMLKSKAKNDLEYREFFSNFEISSMGIELKSYDPITLAKIDKYLDDNLDLVDYLRLHKQGVDLRPSEEQEFRDDLFLRNYYSNFPASLKAYKGNFTKLSKNVLMADTKDTFIRINDGVYELSQGIGGKGIYARLETNDSDFKIYDKNLTPAELDIDISEITAIETNFDADTQINNTYTQEEKDQIDNKEDNC